MSLRVAIDSGPLTSGHAIRGIGVMVKEQIRAIENVSADDINLDAFDFESDEGKLKLESEEYDIVHYTSFFPYSLTLPEKKYGKKVVVTIQDLINLVYPKKYPPGVRGKINFWKQKLRLRNVDAIITISETSKKDIVKFLGFPADKVFVCYLAPMEIYKKITDKKKLQSIRKKYNLPSEFVFNLGDINYNKNIPNLINACEIADIHLVIGGKQAKELDDVSLINLMDLKGPMDYLRFLFNISHPETEHYKNLIERFKDTKVKRLGFVPDEDVPTVMSLATIYCQPSLYEGFGLSVVHAFACDVPVVISKTNCLVELWGDAALIADPYNSADMAEKILKLRNNRDLRTKLIERGKLRLKDFSWKKTAGEIIDVYKSLSNSN